MLLYLRLFAHNIVGEQHWSIDETVDLDRNMMVDDSFGFHSQASFNTSSADAV